MIRQYDLVVTKLAWQDVLDIGIIRMIGYAYGCVSQDLGPAHEL